jgi:hypothetical protein
MSDDQDFQQNDARFGKGVTRREALIGSAALAVSRFGAPVGLPAVFGSLAGSQQALVSCRATRDIATAVAISVNAIPWFARAADQRAGKSTYCAANQGTFSTNSRRGHSSSDRGAAKAANGSASFSLRARGEWCEHRQQNEGVLHG